MAEVKCKEVSMAEGGQEEGEDEEMAGNTVEDKVSIQQILEGMTNEFNKSVSPVKSAEIERSEVRTGKFEADAKEQEAIVARDDDSLDENRIVEDEKVEDEIVENCLEGASEESRKEDEAGAKQDVSKKDGSIPRIVLTFRTIDENTDCGRKTKISSCSSNLTLVPDELGNCEQIGGVSVKIENSDENSDVVEKSDSEEGRIEEVGGTEKPEIVEEDKEDVAAKETDKLVSTSGEEVAESTEQSVKNDEADVPMAELAEQPEPPPPIVTRKRRAGRSRLRALRFSFFFTS